MTNMDDFLKLATAARQESIPTIDVSDRVLTSLRDPAVVNRAPATDEYSYYIVALAAVSSAAIVMLFAWNALAAMRDPLIPLVDPLYLVLR